VRVEIKRTYREKQTEGNLTVFDETGKAVFICKTLELPWRDNKRMISCIPEGEYIVDKRAPHAMRKYEHFIVNNVPNRSYILIHSGNYVWHVLGCILVGDAHKDINKDGLLDVVNSKSTLKILVNILPAKFKLKIM
jgi:hypothetical protein